MNLSVVARQLREHFIGVRERYSLVDAPELAAGCGTRIDISRAQKRKRNPLSNKELRLSRGERI